MKNQVILKNQNGPAGQINPAVAALAVLMAVLSPALADDDQCRQPVYAFTTFDVPFTPPPAEGGGTSCWGLNNRGALVGNYGVANEYWPDGVTLVVGGFHFARREAGVSVPLPALI